MVYRGCGNITSALIVNSLAINITFVQWIHLNLSQAELFQGSFSVLYCGIVVFDCIRLYCEIRMVSTSPQLGHHVELMVTKTAAKHLLHMD